MDRLAEIEAEIQAGWDRDTLDVYADALQASGDPRGTLIALAGRPSTPELIRTRDRFEAAWLGEFQLARPSWMATHTGFVSTSFRDLAGATSFLSSHLAPFLLRVEVMAPPDECAAILDALASRVHAWCIELTIGFTGLHREAVPVPSEIIDRIAEAMPRVTTLRLRERHLLHAPLPSQIEKLVLESPRALVGRPRMPAVTELILPSIHHHERRREGIDLLRPQTFPGLRRLDFKDNEGHIGDVLALLEHVEALDRLSWVRLPSLRSEREVRRVRDLLARAPGLVIELARSHRPLAHLLPMGAPRIRVADPVPCPPYDSFEGVHDLLDVVVPGSAQPFDFYISSLAYHTETHYSSFSSEQQAALTALWDRIPALGAPPVGFPAAAMERVVEAMMATDLDAQMGFAPWEALGEVLRRLSCAVMISRRG